MLEVKGMEKLAAVFGKWPSFHDAEVLSLRCEQDAQGASVYAVFHVFEMTREVDPTGYFKLKNHSRVTLCFIDCEDVRIENFRRQNVLLALEIERREGEQRPYRVAFEPSCGVETRLECRHIEVVDIQPWGQQSVV